MNRGCGQHRTTKLQRGNWVAIDSNIEFAYTIKGRRQRNINQRRKVFMNSPMLQHREDKVLKNYVVLLQLQNMISFCQIYD